MPMMMTTRSAIVCEYKGQISDGLNIMVMSSEGNENLYKDRAKQIGDDKIALPLLKVIGYKIDENGLLLWNIMTLNHLARVPEFLASKIRERVSRSLLTLVDYFREGNIPEP